MASWRDALGPVRRLHPLHRLRSVPGVRQVLARADRVVDVTLPGLPGTVRVRAVRHAAYRMLPMGPEPEFRKRFDAECARATTLFDVGANFGYYSIAFLAKGEGRTAVAVEPDDDNLALLRANAEGRQGLVVEAAVVSSVEGEVAFASDAATGHTGHVTTGAGVAVRATTLDGLAETYGAPDVVKIDVEGHELEVLRGASRVLSARPGAVFVECFHGLEGPCVSLLRAAGFALTDAEDPSGGAPTERTTNFLAR